MWVSIDFCLIPIGSGTSLSPFISACQKIIENRGLDYALEASGTVIEGDWDDVFDCVRACHEEVHRLGALRIFTTLKINSRSDRNQSFREKVPSVRSKMNLNKG